MKESSRTMSCYICQAQVLNSKLSEHISKCKQEQSKNQTYLDNSKFADSPFKKLDIHVIDKTPPRNQDNEVKGDSSKEINSAESLATFGKRNNLKDLLKKEEKGGNKGLDLSTNEVGKQVKDKTMINKQEENLLAERQAVGIKTQITDSNSSLTAVIQMIWSMKLLRRFIQGEVKLDIEGVGTDIYHSQKNFLSNLQSIFKEYKKLVHYKKPKSFINIQNLQSSLSNLLKRKIESSSHFDIQLPEPQDLYHLIVNALHSYFLKDDLTSHIDVLCKNKCFSHNYLWLDIHKIYKCDCGASKKKALSYHNYVYDIPLYLVLDSVQYKDYDIKGEFFDFYTKLVSKVNLGCPSSKAKCKAKVIKQKLFISQIPYYLTFNLTLLDNTKDSGCSNTPNNPRLDYHFGLDTLYTMLLMPQSFNLSNLFEHNKKNSGLEIEYEISSIVCKNKTGNYSFYAKNMVVLPQETKETVTPRELRNIWLRIEGEKVEEIENHYLLTESMIKRSELACMLVFTLKKMKEKEDICVDHSFTKQRFEEIHQRLLLLKSTHLSKSNDMASRIRPKLNLLEIDEGEFKAKNTTNNTNNTYNNTLNSYKRNSKSNSISSTVSCQSCGKLISNEATTSCGLCSKCNQQTSKKNMKQTEANKTGSIPFSHRQDYHSNKLQDSSQIDIELKKLDPLDLIKNKLKNNQTKPSFLRCNSNSRISVSKDGDESKGSLRPSITKGNNRTSFNKNAKGKCDITLCHSCMKTKQSCNCVDKEIKIKISDKSNFQKGTDIPKPNAPTMETLIKLANKPSVRELFEKKKNVGEISSSRGKNHSFTLTKNEHARVRASVDGDDSCLCTKINNTENILFEEDVCKLCGDKKDFRDSSLFESKAKDGVSRVKQPQTSSFNSTTKRSNQVANINMIPQPPHHQKNKSHNYDKHNHNVLINDNSIDEYLSNQSKAQRGVDSSRSKHKIR